ncbi:Putative dehydrogenase [Hyphomicrobiales bacterium]|nr:putative dehydrogenase [Hyphomicrobiales bacterium]CAH1695519.1 Putative dehydrogenase [Hyphomicrobiales bacterium]
MTTTDGISARRLRVGLLGTGGVASKYASLYGEYPRSELVAVHDPFDPGLGALAERFGARIASSTDALINSDIEAVIISTPNQFHLAQASAALRAGRHVLLQKPMAVTLDEAETLAAIARDSGKTLALYMNSLDNPIFRDLKRMIDEGVLGEVGSINCKLANGMGHVWRNRPANFWRASRSAVGGGSFAMLACHYLNLAQWLLGQQIVRTAAVGKNLMCDHIEGDDIMSAIVEFADGAMGVIESAWCVKGEQMSVHGSSGSIAYIDNSVISLKAESPFAGEAIHYDKPGTRIVIEGLSAPAMGDWQNAYNQHRCFVDAMLAQQPVVMSADKGVQDMRVLAAAYRSAVSGRREAVFTEPVA